MAERASAKLLISALAVAALVVAAVIVARVGDDDGESTPASDVPSSSVSGPAGTGPDVTGGTDPEQPDGPGPIDDSDGGVVESGPLVATPRPSGVRFRDGSDADTLRTVANGSLIVTTADGRHRSTSVVDTEFADGGARLTFATDHPGGRHIVVVLRPAGDGSISMSVRPSGPSVQRVAVDFAAQPDERFFGLGQRATAVDHRRRRVENRVHDGPYRAEQMEIVKGLIPEPGFSSRKDATYFPVPWVLSSRGYGVLVDNDHTSWFDLATPERPGRWTVGVDAPRLDLRLFAGPKPADALERMSAAIGRQPDPSAPFVLGPWWQPAGDEVDELAAIARADVPVSLAQTYTHYLPCADHRGQRADERARTKRMHDAGMAVTTYINPMVCTDFSGVYERGETEGGFTAAPDGGPYRYRYSTADQFDVAQFDFSSAEGRQLFHDVLDLTIADGYDGWMEDFGEYTPTDAVSVDGTLGPVMHNRYVEQYHAAANDYAEAAPRPLARYNRSGWTGAIAESPIVWGGDPTATWGFDGLTSAVYSGLGMGLSGVGVWGSDIGGFFLWFEDELTPELLNRWIQFGALSGVMRLQSGGISLSSVPRAQVLDPDVLPVWRRYSKLRTQLYPYLAGAQETYRATGMPLMRHHVLSHPDDAEAVGRHDQYMFGADLLVAPVIRPGARRRKVYLPAGEWVDLWRSTRYVERDGSLALGDVTVRRGTSTVTVDAPADEIPIHVRSGAVVPLLPADVDTLADYGAGSDVVRLADRDDRRVLLAFPGPKWSGPLGPGERLEARSEDDRWTLDVRSKTARTYELHASLAGLGDSDMNRFEPCSLTADGEPVPFTHDATTRVVRADVALPGDGTITIEACQ